MLYRPKKIICIVGTRPEVIKMAPVIRALASERRLDVQVLCSGQHREILAPLFDWFEISVNEDLRVMTENQSLGELTSRLVQRFQAYVTSAKPDLVIGQGDTTTVMCAALCCFYNAVPFAHVEAGLRTHNLHNPFPEEFNRVVAGKLARLHFCPTRRAVRNLEEEGVTASSLHLTGNTVVDALYFTRDKLPPIVPCDERILLTTHRRENFGTPLENIFRAVLRLCADHPQVSVLYPVHPNPNVMGPAHRLLGGHPQITLTAPMNYPDLVAAMLACRCILTDSGGIQEEAPALRKPVLVLREETERPEAIELGVARLVGSDEAKIVEECGKLLLDPAHYEAMTSGGSPYGDGESADRIRKLVMEMV
jgi:UDP-N-acetylglucosamine 2-epimerase (non-hydrolysing)